VSPRTQECCGLGRKRENEKEERGENEKW